jgi:hypothetical protein
MKALIAIVACSASLVAVPALAQDGGADPRAPGAYAGVSKEAFYAVMQQLSAAESQAAGRPGAMREIRSLRAFANQQQARHGEIRDWDRETINKRLSALGLGGGEALTTAPAR